MTDITFLSVINRDGRVVVFEVQSKSGSRLNALEIQIEPGSVGMNRLPATYIIYG